MLPLRLCEHKIANMKRPIRTTTTAGFTLLEIMIVASIIGLLATLAIPAFVKARSRSVTTDCINNLRQIDDAKSQWALENHKDSTTVPLDADLFGPGLYIKAKPMCRVGGQYDLRTVGEPTLCDQPGHGL
jgi:prepilin-type N-terminal cleavage/methylation domain-containing protein